LPQPRVILFDQGIILADDPGQILTTALLERMRRTM
jgi:hypothetical protein